MLELEFSTEEVEALRYWRFHHPHPHVQLKMEVVYQAHSQHQAELESLLTLQFQTFREVPVIGEEGQVSPFPGAK